MSAFWDIYESPLGPLTVSASEHGLTRLSFPGRADEPAGSDRRPEALAAAFEQLEQYFDGERREFELDLDLAGTRFQQLVWQRLLEIPYGTTVSYSQLAEAVGRPDIVRGVAAMVGQTPVPIVIRDPVPPGRSGERRAHGIRRGPRSQAGAARPGALRRPSALPALNGRRSGSTSRTGSDPDVDRLTWGQAPI